ncbi:MAG: HNH endonuclease, partial [Acidobacteria bacterium]|nr:HNH endonuclease [Acidobacteriota bacterium]
MFKHPLEYKGDGLSGLMQRAFTALAITRRKLFNDEDRNAVKLRQDGKCAKCQDPIVKFEVDHITPLCQGGSNEPSNLQALCKPCHADKTQTEERSGTRIHTVESHMSPKLWRDLHKAPKPAQICWGLFETSSQLQEKLQSNKQKMEDNANKALKLNLSWALSQRSKKVPIKKDLVLKKDKPRVVNKIAALPEDANMLQCMDARSCRVFALTKRTRDLPIFSALDELEPFNLDLLPKYQFVYVDAGTDIIDREPYFGPTLYAAEVVEYMLDIHVIRLEHCVAGLQSTRSMSAGTVAQHFQSIRDCWNNTVWLHLEGPALETKKRGYTKESILALIGLWNSTEQHSWKAVTSTHQTDAGGNVSRKRDLGDGVFQFFSSTELISL